MRRKASPTKGRGIDTLRRGRDFVRRFAQVNRLIRSDRTPPTSIYQPLYFDGVLSVEVASGVSFKIECQGEQIENEFLWRGFGNSYEGKSLRLWAELAKSADYVADIGANTGVYSLLTKAVRPSAKVIALEPSPRVFTKLQRNIDLNGYSIVAVDVAASDKSGVAPFFDLASPHQYTGSLESDFGGPLKTSVPVERMDQILAQHGFDRLDLVKIDVELHEPAVLRGMRNTLERWKPTMLVEILNEDVERGIREAIAGLDYRLVAVGGQGSPHPVSDARNYIIARPDAFEAKPLARLAAEKSPDICVA